MRIFTRQLSALLLVLALAVAARGDTHYWTGQALDVAQVTTITIDGTWATGDTAYLQIGRKLLQLTVGTDTTTAAIATALKEMVNGDAQTGTGDHTFSATGDQIPEWQEVTATVSGSVVTLTANTAGKPFTVTPGSNTAGTGSLSGAVTATAATGKHFFTDGDNWDLGVAPVSGDSVVFASGDVDCKYGLDHFVTMASFTRRRTYTGNIGLRRVNQDNAAAPYFEYRKRRLRVPPTVPATYKCQLGTGAGLASGGFTFLNFLDFDAKVIISDTAPLLSDGTKPIELVSGTGDLDLTVISGHVSIGSYGEEESEIKALRVGFDQNQASDATVHVDATFVPTSTITQSGGEIVVESDTTNATTVVHGGTLKLQSGAHAGITLLGGRLIYNSDGDLASVTVHSGATADFSQDLRPKTITGKAILHRGATYDDRFGAVGVPTGGYDLVDCAPNDVTLRVRDNYNWDATAL